MFVAGYTQPAMVGGPIEYRRKYTLWVLVLLVILCWPAAIIYYFTRDKVPVQEYQTYAMPVHMPAAGAAPMAGAPGSAPLGGTTTPCPRCGRPATWMPQYNRWYCPSEQTYV